ncbi:glycosyltransferase family 39 protein [Vibrio alfacsensis]|uniref:glycosyltransferase family 39 protein n=1 Tax=Vibrio alfacsensis TaxID=1074311 RepID=UPI0040683BA6
MNKEKIRQWLGISLALIFGLYVYIAFNAEFVNDDYMALYSTWLISTGKVAGADFNVDSFTLLFDWMAPVYYLVGEHFEIAYVFRSIFLLLLTFMGWQVFVVLRQFFTMNVVLATLIILFSSSAIIIRGIDLRPDLVILILWLQTIIVLFVYSGSDARKLFWAGLLLGFAMLFKFKAILICVVIGLYGLNRLVHKRCVRGLLLDSLAFFLGLVTCIAFFIATAGFASLEIFLNTTRDLLLYSTTHAGDANSLKLKVLTYYFLKDVSYWLLALAGVVIAIRNWQPLSSNQRECAFMLVMLAILSIAANPHYHAYNLVTLYPLLALFVGFSLQHIVRCTTEWSKGKVVYCGALLAILVIRNVQYPVEHNNQHQIALQTFIDKQVQVDEAVFAFEGIGMFRPSTYHWRTSAIKVSNYHDGRYSVWQEISKTKPILIIENYRVPNWLLEDERDAIYQHYVSIAPSILSLGLKTQAEIKGELLKSGWYTVDGQGNNRCWIDGNEFYSGDKFWLDAGKHILQTDAGTCILHWYFSTPELYVLRQSNLYKRPYLFSP